MIKRERTSRIFTFVYGDVVYIQKPVAKMGEQLFFVRAYFVCADPFYFFYTLAKPHYRRKG